MVQAAVALLLGVAFALGLGVSGMTDPRNVLAFLDVGGRWDGSLALVMGGALAVYVAAARWARAAPRPLAARCFAVPRSGAIDARLLGGAAVFGLGWGIAGYCPGPAVVDAIGLAPPTLVFVASMLAATAVTQRLLGRRARSTRRGAADDRRTVPA